MKSCERQLFTIFRKRFGPWYKLIKLFRCRFASKLWKLRKQICKMSENNQFFLPITKGLIWYFFCITYATVVGVEKAFAKILDNTNIILRSDQWWQYQHKHYRKMLKDKGVRQSMSKKATVLITPVLKTFSVL